MSEDREAKPGQKVRYAVVGLGHAAQAEVLPAFERCSDNSELAAFVSDDPVKHKKLGKKYRVGLAYTYEDYASCLKSGEIDAVCLTVPSPLRHPFALRAAEAGIHVFCRQPMGRTPEEAEAVLRAAGRRQARLMASDGLRFDESHAKALEFARAGKLGELRSFHAVVASAPAALSEAFLVEPGGALLVSGIHCIETARRLFGCEPEEAFAYSVQGPGEHSRGKVEFTAALLRFDGGRVASFMLGSGASELSLFHIFGSKGELRCEPAFEHVGEQRHAVVLQGKRKERSFERRGIFERELRYFSDCILQNHPPEPSGVEGVANLRVACALQRAIREGRPVAIGGQAGGAAATRPREAKAVAASTPIPRIPPLRAGAAA